MRFELSEEQHNLRDLLRQFLRKESPLAEIRRSIEDGNDLGVSIWQRLGSELGILGLTIPEVHGGLGFGPVELAVVSEEMGRTLACPAYLGTVGKAVALISALGSPRDQERLLPPITRGQHVGTVAVGEDATSLDAIDTTYERRGSGWLLTTAKPVIVHDADVDLTLVVARESGTSGRDTLAVFVVKGDPSGVTRRPQPTLDLTRPATHLEFSGVEASPLGDVPAGPALADALHEASVYQSAEMLGGAESCLEMAVEYAKVRTQFGRPIGSFQAIKHKCADVLVGLEAARSAVYHAAWCAAHHRDELAIAAPVAVIAAGEAYLRAAAENIQIHGGTGFTWEHDAHLYYRRAHASVASAGNPDEHRRGLLTQVG